MWFWRDIICDNMKIITDIKIDKQIYKNKNWVLLINFKLYERKILYYNE